MLLAGVCAAETDAEAGFLRSSQILAFARLRMGRPGKLPRPSHDLSDIPATLRADVEQALSCSAVGSPVSVRRQLSALIDRHAPDEIMVTGMIHDHAARVRSLEITAEVLRDLGIARAA
jgi:alkanesulfonate monooxygenase SsuD/methylene tetrahydromethanopterin reductase-like flavin-dependent oxidoreductase (luciferase family)